MLAPPDPQYYCNYLFNFIIGFKPEFFIVGMVLAILTIQGLYQTGASVFWESWQKNGEIYQNIIGAKSC